ncbi:MAG: cell wall hydrolase [Oscillospiraceae bacterium]|jgi:N-acetylmuramoyl-L-alanine amidase|nr:cell wall hydrolase [Oscillospiraceae bacterium]
MKKQLLLPILLAFAVVFGSLTPAAAAPPSFASAGRVAVLINGDAARMRSAAILIDSTAYVSVRDLCAALGAEHVYRAGDTATVTADGLTISATVGDNYIVANGRYLFTRGGCVDRNGELMAPIRALTKAFGAGVLWNAAQRQVFVTEGSRPIAPAETFYREEDVLWMSRIISAEARGEPFLGKVAVGNVIMNRIASPLFPNSVKAVVFDRNGGTQFTPASSGAIYNTPSESCVAAAKAALDGGEVVGNSLYFASTTRCWAARSRPYMGSVGNHVFYA